MASRGMKPGRPLERRRPAGLYLGRRGSNTIALAYDAIRQHHVVDRSRSSRRCLQWRRAPGADESVSETPEGQRPLEEMPG